MPGNRCCLKTASTIRRSRFRPRYAQFIATRLQSIDEIATIFGVPPHMVGDLSHSTYSNNEQQNLEFYNVTPLAVDHQGRGGI